MSDGKKSNQNDATGEISDEQLEDVAGGTICVPPNPEDEPLVNKPENPFGPLILN